MRKLVTLFIAPLLATGAIQSANADSVNVIENPEGFILVEQMIEGVVSLSRGVEIEASTLKPSVGGDDVVYTTSAPGAANAFALECLVPELSPVFISNPGSSVLISDAVASNTQSSIEDPKGLPDHNYTLHAGEGVDFGGFTNTVTVGIGETL